MRQVIVWSALAVVFVASDANAQPSGPPRTTPTVSPYINLARSGNSAGLNYYGLVRPQFSAQQSFQALQGQINQNSMNIAGFSQQQIGGVPGADGGLSPTGFRVGYMTHYAYFQNSGAGFIRGGSRGGSFNGGFGSGSMAGAGGRGTPSFGGGSGNFGSGFGGNSGFSGGVGAGLQGASQSRPPRR